VLSPFSVSGDKDEGYRASNSIAGTRTNTPIKDIPLNIQVFTKELSDDLLITNQVDLERYNASLVNGGADVRSDVPIQQAYNQFLFRGFVQNWGLRDGIREYDPIDTQGLARVEVVKGPAAPLYGLAYPGGIMNNITKDVDFSRSFTDLRFTVQSEGEYRGSIDANYSGPAAEGKIGIRFNAADVKSQDERSHSRGSVQYSQLGLTWKPFPATSLKLLGERGYREKPNGLSYFTVGETNAAGVGLGNGASIPLQIKHPEIPWDWNWSNGKNMRSLDTKLYRGTVEHTFNDSFSVFGYVQYSSRVQVDGNGWDANGSGGADSWEAGGGWIIDPVTKAEHIEAGYSYRDWSNNMHAYGATGIYKVDVMKVKNTFAFGANVWGEKFVSRSATQANATTPIHIPYQLPGFHRRRSDPDSVRPAG
jgi:outer membrane receptor protein involved in Fe transport